MEATRMHGQHMTQEMIIYDKNETLRIGKREKIFSL